MSEVICAIKVEGELIINIDFDRPVWRSRGEEALAIVPHPDHFVVDAILGTASQSTLTKIGVSRHFTSDEFESGSPELDAARSIVYAATGYSLQYLNPFGKEQWIDEDFERFQNKPEIIKIDEASFNQLVGPR